MSPKYNSAYDELAQFLASLSPRKVLAFKASPKSQMRVEELLKKNSTTGLTDEENDEMDQYMAIEHIVRLAKARAFQRLENK